MFHIYTCAHNSSLWVDVLGQFPLGNNLLIGAPGANFLIVIASEKNIDFLLLLDCQAACECLQEVHLFSPE